MKSCSVLLLLLLGAALLLQAGSAAAQDSAALAENAKCQQAQKELPSNPDIQAFKQCASAKPITAACCQRVKPYSQYLPCLSYEQYRAAPNNFLAPLSMDDVMAACFSPP
ncbi:hypothetical protein HXX76_003792 [Chlamydomonas incerta]|uniref:Bifunctional inhibitor/plant lipid transfer protein/seed storage helical domain-containing protein n=1 Tax=Chlamydomonas incerta TaxID=51695 RepID=A0A835W869_CHLIN|nr:hypothetical protein HXX76_003792 [Chlamydomonas incerta]|eukprot:KAG2440939.1 hypothetical protein HXX76_003792 [Chlamydomonas incerta]